MTDPTQRFSNRVENYIKYRPTYPPEVIDVLREECQLTPIDLIADIGSGTGILAGIFLNNGNQVFAVEPNREMRQAGERLFGNKPGFHSVDAKAEATTLPDHSVDFIAAGQAFHWFDREKAREEFLRILKLGGWVILVWNDREIDTTPFLIEYEQLLKRYATDYDQVNHKLVDETILGRFYRTHGFKLKVFDNLQRFDFTGLEGRLLSSSYAPEAGHPNHAPMLAELERIFQAHQVNGRVEFVYKTTMYYGQL